MRRARGRMVSIRVSGLSISRGPAAAAVCEARETLEALPNRSASRHRNEPIFSVNVAARWPATAKYKYGDAIGLGFRCGDCDPASGKPGSPCNRGTSLGQQARTLGRDRAVRPAIRRRSRRRRNGGRRSGLRTLWVRHSLTFRRSGGAAPFVRNRSASHGGPARTCEGPGVRCGVLTHRYCPRLLGAAGVLED